MQIFLLQPLDPYHPLSIGVVDFELTMLVIQDAIPSKGVDGLDVYLEDAGQVLDYASWVVLDTHSYRKVMIFDSSLGARA